MNNYYDRFLAESKGAWSYQEWLIDKLEKAEVNIYELMALEKRHENELRNVCTAAREFIDAIRDNKNRVAHYKMLELETYLEEYGYGRLKTTK